MSTLAIILHEAKLSDPECEKSSAASPSTIPKCSSLSSVPTISKVGREGEEEKETKSRASEL